MGKRSNGEGSIYKRKDGKWCASYFIDTNEGQKRKYLYGKTQKEVKDRLKKLQEENSKGLYTVTSDMLFETWMFEWLQNYKKRSLKQTSFDNYLINYETHIRGSKIGKTHLNQLTGAKLQSFYNEKLQSNNLDDKGLSERTVRYLKILINGALEQAIKNDLIIKNPNKATVLPSKKHIEIIPLSAEELMTLLSKSTDSALYPLIFLEVYTGLRRGEILGLKWEDIDFDSKRLYVRRNLCRVSTEPGSVTKTKLVLMDPKTAKSKRIIPLSNDVISVLDDHRKAQNIIKKQNHDIYNDQNTVFAKNNGDFLDPREMLRDFHKLLKKIGIRKCRFHDLRHSFASLLLNSGESPKVIQELLGHSTITTTMDIYSHLNDSTKSNSIDKLSTILTSDNKI